MTEAYWWAAVFTAVIGYLLAGAIAALVAS